VLCNQLWTVWQGLQSTDETFDEDTDCDIEEIRQLIDSDEPSNPSDNTTPMSEEVG